MLPQAYFNMLYLTIGILIGLLLNRFGVGIKIVEVKEKDENKEKEN